MGWGALGAHPGWVSLWPVLPRVQWPSVEVVHGNRWRLHRLCIWMGNRMILKDLDELFGDPRIAKDARKLLIPHAAVLEVLTGGISLCFSCGHSCHPG